MMYSTSIKIIFHPAECRSSAKFPQQLGPRVTDSKLFQATVHQCTENTKKKKSNRDFASTPCCFFLEPFLSVLLL